MKRPEIKDKKPKVGDKVFVVTHSHRGKKEAEEYKTVEKVGRKFFYVENGIWPIKVRIENWREDTQYSSSYSFYENEKSYRDYKRWNELHSNLRSNYFDHMAYRNEPLTLEQLEASAKIIGIPPRFETVSVGDYDTLMRCIRCGFQYCESADASSEENLQRSKHECKS